MESRCRRRSKAKEDQTLLEVLWSWIGLSLFNYMVVATVLTVEAKQFRLVVLLVALSGALVLAFYNAMVVIVHSVIAWALRVKNPLASGLIATLAGALVFGGLYLLPGSLLSNPFDPVPTPPFMAFELCIVLGWIGYGVVVARLRQSRG